MHADIASVLVAWVFAISYVQQQVLALGNLSEGGAGATNQSGNNSTNSAAASLNKSISSEMH